MLSTSTPPATSASGACTSERVEAPLHDALAAQLGDPLVAEAKLAQDLVGMLAQLRGGRADPRWRALEVDAACQQRQRAERFVLDRRGDRQRLDLLVGKAL